MVSCFLFALSPVSNFVDSEQIVVSGAVFIRICCLQCFSYVEFGFLWGHFLQSCRMRLQCWHNVSGCLGNMADRRIPPFAKPTPWGSMWCPPAARYVQAKSVLSGMVCVDGATCQPQLMICCKGLRLAYGFLYCICMVRPFCETGRIAMRNGPFRVMKRPVSERNPACFGL